LDEAAVKYPKGHFYLYLAGYYHRAKGNIDQAIKCFELCSECSIQNNFVRNYCLYEFGWCYYLLQDWQKSIEYLEKFVSVHKSPTFVCYAEYQLGICYTFVGQKETALASFKKAPPLVRKYFTFDHFASRKSKDYLKNKGMTDVEQKIVLASIQYEALQYSQALNTLNALKEYFDSKNSNEPDFLENMALYLFFKGASLRGNGDLEEAKESLQKLISMEKKVRRETYVIPYSIVELAEIHILQQHKKEAKMLLLNFTKTYTEFDLDKPLFRKVNKWLDKLKEEDKE